MSGRQKAKQLEFTSFSKSKSFGGTLYRKAANRGIRPLTHKKSIHLVLRSNMPQRSWSFRNPRNHKIVTETLRQYAERYGIRIQEFAAAGNHLHLLMRITNRASYLNFIRAFTGAIALKISGTNKLSELSEKFWKFRPFTRIVDGWKGYRIARDYVILNALEAIGMIPYQKDRLKGWALRTIDVWGPPLAST